MQHRRLLVLALLALLAGCIPHSSGRISRKLDRLDTKVDQVLENQSEMMADLDELVERSRRQGTGEITLFFPWTGDRLFRGTAQHERLVAFADRLAMEAHGREILLVAIGSAADWSGTTWNRNLSTERAIGAQQVLDRHLVHVPHRWLRTVGAGRDGHPPDAHGRTWRNVRVIAVYEEEQLPVGLP